MPKAWDSAIVKILTHLLKPTSRGNRGARVLQNISPPEVFASQNRFHGICAVFFFVLHDFFGAYKMSFYAAGMFQYIAAMSMFIVFLIH